MITAPSLDAMALWNGGGCLYVAAEPGAEMTTPKTARINDQLITVQPRETLLQAALRAGIAFPNSCRVGGCSTCKCRLTEGKVKELTETAYLLTAEELDRGYILACQSVPQTDVRLEVSLATTPSRRVEGRVVAQQKVTHDIVNLTVQLDTPLDYRAGQFADIQFSELPGVVRSYSFATPSRADGRIGFFIRKIPEGQLSSFVFDTDVMGKRVVVEGPSGHFWLRDDDAPIIMIAGGSGLPPVLAMLEEAASKGSTRSVTLLFGVREQRDLYALDEIAALSRTWKGRFQFVPVLSAEAADSGWSGARGHVSALIPEYLEKGAHAYLCGPPPMVDAAVEVLRAKDIPREHVHFDRFTSRADRPMAADAVVPPVVTTQSSAVVNVLHYLKFFLFHVVGLLSALSLLAGGRLTTIGLFLILGFVLLGDALGGDDRSTPVFRHPTILTVQLWLALPLLSFIVFAFVWGQSTGDPLGFGAWLTQLSGYDVLGARAASGLGSRVSAWVLTGLMIGMVGTIPAHELTHRTWDPVSMWVGRWLLAFSFDTIFSIEHVYGHHRYVSTAEDPATAPRGRSVYLHVLMSTIRGNVSAWKIEAARLAKKRQGVFSWHNAFLRGHGMSLLLVAGSFALGGVWAAAAFVAAALWGKALLEIVNYMEHYGMVRNPETPVQPRHSWNTNRRVSSWIMFNLTRHSHHHAQGEVPYQDLRPYPDAPMMIGGYLMTIVIALIPPFWHRLMTPRVLAWDRDHATDEERVLATKANAQSGLRALAGLT
jgi:NAD(P)H-flavin reductase/ferredoxin